MPAVAFGFICCPITLYGIFKYLFTSDMGVDTTPSPSKDAVTLALTVGFIIPILSVIPPIQTALAKNLNESLDLQRSKTQAIYIEVLDTENQNIWSYLTFGVIAVAYGMTIYYFLPLAMLSFNFAMILIIFFLILVGMLLGLSLLAFNL